MDSKISPLASSSAHCSLGFSWHCNEIFWIKTAPTQKQDNRYLGILLMEEILHQSVCFIPLLTGFYTSQEVSRIFLPSTVPLAHQTVDHTSSEQKSWSRMKVKVMSLKRMMMMWRWWSLMASCWRSVTWAFQYRDGIEHLRFWWRISLQVRGTGYRNHISGKRNKNFICHLDVFWISYLSKWWCKWLTTSYNPLLNCVYSILRWKTSPFRSI